MLWATVTKLTQIRLSLHELYCITSVEQLELSKAETGNCSTALRL